ncbi:hypothetical protein GOP47_0020692 [Adiantum capillus-veneris]|uniref:AT-hook motif nuclear-localized protein n=1 Tax=Adiantum capillus-veneris TaxID=13818 RepID=A0A9D4UA06_ADICA|nr:hypothetical protein GOP47_0020692 [Adiantum capillus-veneris]
MGNPPSIITPTAMRHNTVLPSPNPNLPPNLNSEPNSNCVVPNLNPNAIPNPNQSSSAFFDAGSPAAQTPPLGLMANISERSSLETAKRKRGRPRKYAKDENGVIVTLPQSPKPASQKKKGPAAGKKAQLLALGAAGQNFTPHVITVAAGEDVSTKIITFTSQGPWAVCILSANGAISNATLRHAGVSGGAVTYEGRFEILSLSGSFLLTESNGARSRTGGLSVSLAGPDGRVIGGGVAGLLMAASPVQVVVGTFSTENRKMGGEGTSGVIKPSTMGSGGTQPCLPQMNMDGVERVHDHNMGGPTDGEEQSRAYHIMLPLLQVRHRDDFVQACWSDTCYEKQLLNGSQDLEDWGSIESQVVG